MHGIRLFGKLDDDEGTTRSVGGRRIFDEAVSEAAIVIWEVADRIRGKRLKAALPHLVESMERHGQLDSTRRYETGCWPPVQPLSTVS